MGIKLTSTAFVQLLAIHHGFDDRAATIRKLDLLSTP